MLYKTACQRNSQLIALAKKTMYKQYAFNGEESLHPRGRDACTEMKCLPVGELFGTGITNLQCASVSCKKCGILNSPTLEGETYKVIRWYAFKVLPTCTHCGTMQMGSKHCNFCLKKFKINPKKQGKISRRKHLVLQQQRFDFFGRCTRQPYQSMYSTDGNTWSWWKSSQQM